MVDISRASGRLGSRRRLDEMAWPEILSAIENGQRTVVAAAGSMEQHGPHLPLQTDTLLGSVIVDAVIERLPDVLMGPTIPFGVSGHHMPFAGTITLDTELFKEVVRQYVSSLASHGFEHVFIVPSHGGNFAPLAELERETGGLINGARFVPYTDLQQFIQVMYEIAAREDIAPAVCGAHAGEAETSMVWASRPDLVQMEFAEQGFVGDFDQDAQRAVFERGMIALTSNGILGDARLAAPERGVAYVDALASMLSEWIRERTP